MPEGFVLQSMRRLAAFVFCGASVAFAAWMMLPVRPDSSYRIQAASASTSADVAALDKELKRFDARMTPHSAAPSGDRDPFGYAVPVAKARPAPTLVQPPQPPPPPPAPTLPKLIAISTKSTPAGLVRTAALSIGDGVLLAHPGDKVGTLVVHTIDDGVVELVDPVTGAAYRVR
jgi:hypothetical protein